MLFSRWTRHRENRRSQSTNRCHRRAPQFEYLEARRVLATVTLNTDTGLAGELRTEIANAAPGETIDFNLSADNETIVLTAGELTIDKGLTIDGDNAGGSGVDVTISGGGTARVMNVDDANAMTYATVNLSNLTVTGGVATQGGGIQNAEVLTLSNATISGNSATSGTGGGINSIGYGSELHLIDSIVDGNYAYGTGRGDRQAKLIGDFNDDGIVGAGDLGLVLSNWGVESPPVPDGWINQQPTGLIGAAQLSTVLSRWGDTGGGVSPATGGGVFVSLGSLTIEGSTISNNSASGPDGTDMAGGGIAVASYLAPDYTQSAPLDVNISGSMITGNVVSGEAQQVEPYNGVDPYGGGLYASGYGQVIVSDSNISGNTATGIGPNYGRGSGAAFFAIGDSALNIDIVESDFTSNYSLSGGTVFASQNQYYEGSMQLNISNSTITNNSVAYYGGGVFSRGRYAEPGTFVTTITGSTISNNTAGASGGITVWNADLIVEDSVVSGNSAILTPAGYQGYGGGISAFGVGLYSGDLMGPSYNEQPRLVVRNTTVSGNSAVGPGGAIYAYSADVEIIQSTISGNTAGADGGGVRVATYYSAAYSGSTLIDRSTITLNGSNGTYGGGGLYLDYYHTALTMSNTIVSGNTTTSGYGTDIFDYSSSGLISGNTTYSFIGDNSNSGLAAANPGPDGNGNIVGAPGNLADAMLGPLTDANGGPTPTHLPDVASPVIDVADPTVMPGTAADQRGFERVADGNAIPGARMDIGSVEFGSSPLAGAIEIRPGRQPIDVLDRQSLQMPTPLAASVVFLGNPTLTASDFAGNRSTNHQDEQHRDEDRIEAVDQLFGQLKAGDSGL